MKDTNNHIASIREFITDDRISFYCVYLKKDPDYVSCDVIEYIIRNPLKYYVDDLMYDNPNLSRTDVVNSILICIDLKYLQKYRENRLNTLLYDDSFEV